MKIVNRALVVMAVVLIGAGHAMAGLREAGNGARAVAMGQAQVGSANDSAAVNYNPACLQLARERWDLSGRNIWVQIGKTGYQAESLRLNGVDQNYPYASYMLIGALIPIGKRLTVGVNISNADDWTLVINVASGPSFTRFGPTQQPSGSFGASLMLTKKLSIGFTQLTTLNLNSAPITLDLNALLAGLGLSLGDPVTNLNPKIELDVLPGSSYQFGGLYRPFKWLSLGASYTYKNGTEAYIPILIPAGLLPETKVVVTGWTSQSPISLAFGAGIYPDEHLTFAFDLVYDMWEGTIQWLKFVSTDPNLLNKPYPKVKLKNIWTPRFGFEYRNKMHGKKLSRVEYALRAGYSYYQSPWPTMPEGTTNIDNDAHFFSGGFALGYNPKRGLNYIGIDYFYEYIDLVDRVHKDITRNPAVIVSSGYVTYSGFALTVKL